MPLTEIMAAAGTALSAIEGLRVYSYPPDTVQSPAVVIDLPEVEYDRVAGETYRFPVWLFIGKASDRIAAKETLDYIDQTKAGSIISALEADRTLAGNCQTLAVTHAQPQIATVAGTVYLAVLFQLEVFT